MEGTQTKPTRYILQEKHLMLDNKFVVTDEAGCLYYTVDAKFFAVGDKLLLSDPDGNELIKIRQESLHLHPTYNVISVRQGADEMELGSIKRTVAPWHHELEIDSLKGKYLMEKKGGVFAHEFTLTNDGNFVAVVAKDASPTTSLYWVDVSNDREEYHAFILAMVIELARVQSLLSNSLATSHTGEDKV